MAKLYDQGTLWRETELAITKKELPSAVLNQKTSKMPLNSSPTEKPKILSSNVFQLLDPSLNIIKIVKA